MDRPIDLTKSFKVTLIAIAIFHSPFIITVCKTQRQQHNVYFNLSQIFAPEVYKEAMFYSSKQCGIYNLNQVSHN